MKIRNDFVSNSSSSSFIVISNSGTYDKLNNIDITLPNSQGCTEYGWQTEKYYGIIDKLNWCVLVIYSKMRMEKHFTNKEKISEDISKIWFNSSEMKILLKKVCKKAGINIKIINFNQTYDTANCYIDHQSDIQESPENARMFETDQKLYDFIFNSHSYIDNSNDNGGRDIYDGYNKPKDYTI